MQPIRQVEGVPQARFEERHFTVDELSDLWSLSRDSIRRLFERESGVMVLCNAAAIGRKRRYSTLRIPESVVVRVHRRLTRV